MSSISDLNGDKVTDLAVGVTRDDDGGMDTGAVYILFLNSDGTVKTHQKISDLEVDLVGGGCLIATASFGSELAFQVQQLRELRDNTLLQTNSGATFMGTFNQVYYSFSPTIADYERENPAFKEAVKIMITPLIASLSILNYVNIDSEAEVIGYGVGIILLNMGIYFVLPAYFIIKISRKLGKTKHQ